MLYTVAKKKLLKEKKFSSCLVLHDMNSLKISNTIARSKMTKGQKTIYKTLQGKLKIGDHEPHLNPGVNKLYEKHISVVLFYFTWKVS